MSISLVKRRTQCTCYKPILNKLCDRRVRPTRYAPPACKNPTSHTFRLIALAVDSACSIGVPSFKFVVLSIRKIRCTSGLSISRPGDLDFWPLTLKLVRIIVRGNFPTNFGVSRIGQHLSDVSRNLATLTFDLGGYGTCQWYGSSFSVCIPSS